MPYTCNNRHTDRPNGQVIMARWIQCASGLVPNSAHYPQQKQIGSNVASGTRHGPKMAVATPSNFAPYAAITCTSQSDHLRLPSLPAATTSCALTKHMVVCASCHTCAHSKPRGRSCRKVTTVDASVQRALEHGRHDIELGPHTPRGRTRPKAGLE